MVKFHVHDKLPNSENRILKLYIFGIQDKQFYRFLDVEIDSA